jgi:hypothetical protein
MLPITRPNILKSSSQGRHRHRPVARETCCRAFLPLIVPAGGQWFGTIKLTHGSLKFDKQSTIHKLPSGTTTGVVDVTGKFTGGEFQGTWQLGGFACPKTSYRTKAGAGGSGG